MTRIEKIRQMTDEALAAFLSKIDSVDRLQTCVEYACPDPGKPDGTDPCAVCMLRRLREEGPLMDEEGV